MDALIRSVQLAPSRTRLSEARVDDAASQPVKREADTLRAEIEKQVRAELAAQMQKLYESERERARADGHALATAEAKAAAAKELAQAQDQLTKKVEAALVAMEQGYQAAQARLQASVGEVAFAAVCKLLGHQAASQAFVLNLVEHTCVHLRGEFTATVRLHPRDIDTLRDLLQDRELRVHAFGLKVVADESLKLGGCVVEAMSGHLDGGLESQLRRLHAVLTGTSATSHGVAAERLQVVRG